MSFNGRYWSVFWDKVSFLYLYFFYNNPSYYDPCILSVDKKTGLLIRVESVYLQNKSTIVQHTCTLLQT